MITPLCASLAFLVGWWFFGAITLALLFGPVVTLGAAVISLACAPWKADERRKRWIRWWTLLTWTTMVMSCRRWAWWKPLPELVEAGVLRTKVRSAVGMLSRRISDIENRNYILDIPT